MSILNDFQGTVVANAAIVSAGTNGSIDVFVTDSAQVVIDVNGYYAAQTSLASGTAAAPSLTFAGDSTSGLYSSGAGTVNIATGGTNRLTVAANGNVGIGTTTPGSTLEVAGDINFTGNVLFQGSPLLQLGKPNGVTAFGIGALSNGISAGTNTAIGAGALNVNTTGYDNTAVGGAALRSNTTGADNIAVGAGALGSNTTGADNAATGFAALSNNTTGNTNVAIGTHALSNNTIGNSNIAVGVLSLTSNTSGANNVAISGFALPANITGNNNVAIGHGALTENITGNNNVAIGQGAGSPSGNSSNNIHISSHGSSADNATIRIGTPGIQTSFFPAGVRGITTANNDAVPVVIDSTGQLGTISSSRRFKEEIHDMGSASRDLLRLRPVTFRYKKPYADGSKPIQYGLIAEEVAEVYPDLVAHSADGQIESVKYQVLDSMLLNEVQRQQAEISGLQQQNQDLQRRLARLEAAMASASTEQRIP